MTTETINLTIPASELREGDTVLSEDGFTIVRETITEMRETDGGTLLCIVRDEDGNYAEASWHVGGEHVDVERAEVIA